MSTPAATAVRDFITPLLPGWRIQGPQWVDDDKTARYAVIKPAGGVAARLIREPQFTVTLIGALNDAADVPGERADAIVEAMRLDSGALVYMEAGEPAHFPTNDGRHIFEIAVSTIAE